MFDGPNGKLALADLFEGRSQLIVYHFMLGPNWVEGCPSCSFIGDHFDGMLTHLNARDVTFAVISRAPLCANSGISEADGLEIQVVFLERYGFQL